MIGYVTIGMNDPKRAIAFYDAVMPAIGVKRFFEGGGWAGYALGGKDDGLALYLATPFNGEAATNGNGTMFAFKAGSRANVEAFFEAALQAGGKDEGGPGVRGDGSPPFYAAYVRDPDGNKLCVYYKG